MNFPSSPSLGTTLDLGNGLIWTWNGNAWDLNTNYNQVSGSWWPVVNLVTAVVEEFPFENTMYSDNPTAFAQVNYV